MNKSETANQFQGNISRLSDIAQEPHKYLVPISGYENLPLVSLEEAIQPLISLLPSVQNYASIAKQRCDQPADGLSPDESSAIMLYSMNWQPENECLYVALNSVLRSCNRKNLEPWFLYLKLLLTALYRLPSIENLRVYRAINKDIHKYYSHGKTIVWWGFSTCTTSLETLGDEEISTKSDSRTLFLINCSSGKNIRSHCYDSSADEILLLPATQFKVTGCIDNGSDHHVIHLNETQPPFPLMKPVLSYCYQNKIIACEEQSLPSRIVSRARGFDVFEVETIVIHDESDDKSWK